MTHAIHPAVLPRRNGTAHVPSPGAPAEDAAPLVPGIGGTPLFALSHIGAHLRPGVLLLAKGEHLNPGGSVKDRPAERMIRAGVASGRLHRGVTLIDATSGNTGIAYAMIASRLGLRVQLALPENASPERKAILRAYGADLVLTDPLEGTDGAQAEVAARVARDPDRWFHPNQYDNDENWRAHFAGTGPEILAQTGGRVTHFVAVLGTTGTFTGVTRFLHSHDPEIRAISVQPDSPMHGLEGMKHMATARVPGIYDPTLADGELTISTGDAETMARRLASEEGLLVGPSSGANVAAALSVAETLEEGVVVTVLCDSGMRYLSHPLWNR